MKQAGDDEMRSMTQFVNESSGQFTQALESEKAKITQIQTDAAQVVNQIITSVGEAKMQNAARDLRSANSIL
ncbi:hypothetical protein [Mycobacterium intracellulare]|nr:hypothetical protein [Mycobacterium intracellulare]